MPFKVVHFQNENQENDEMRKIVTAAIVFLKHTSTLASQIINYLETREQPVTIVVKNEDDPNFNAWKPGDATKQGGSGKVYWCSARPKMQGKPSAEISLMHELGHEYQLHTDRETVLNSIRSDGAVLVDQKQYIADFEDTVVLAIERPVAQDINAFLKNTMGVKEGHALYEPIRKAYIRMNVFGAIKGPASYVKQDSKPSKIEKSPRGWTNR